MCLYRVLAFKKQINLTGRSHLLQLLEKPFRSNVDAKFHQHQLRIN